MSELKEEIVLNDDELICVLTGDKKKANAKEQMLQSVILQMNEEYGYEMRDMKRDYAFSYEDEEGKKKRMTVDLAIFRAGAPKEPENLERICIVCDTKVKASDAKKGVEASLNNALRASSCDFGLWTNGDELHFSQRMEDFIGNEKIVDIADFPALGESIDDMERMGDRAQPRKPANDSLIRTFKRCHDYIYGNEGRKKDAFWELLNLIFCKIYDEKRRYLCAERNETYHRQFWVGVTERNTPEGQAAVAQRIKAIFEQLKTDEIFKEVFVGNEQISLSDYGIAYVASEIAKYSFLDATVDVKGTAYETIVSNTLKQEVHVDRLLPIDPDEHDHSDQHLSYLEYEPSSQEVFEYLIGKYLEMTLFSATIESATCEHAARRQAMENANDNASDMLNVLQTRYNRARQSQITDEIIEIVSGSEAQS